MPHFVVVTCCHCEFWWECCCIAPFCECYVRWSCWYLLLSLAWASLACASLRSAEDRHECFKIPGLCLAPWPKALRAAVSRQLRMSWQAHILFCALENADRWGLARAWREKERKWGTWLFSSSYIINIVFCDVMSEIKNNLWCEMLSLESLRRRSNSDLSGYQKWFWNLGHSGHQVPQLWNFRSCHGSEVDDRSNMFKADMADKALHG